MNKYVAEFLNFLRSLYIMKCMSLFDEAGTQWRH